MKLRSLLLTLHLVSMACSAFATITQDAKLVGLRADFARRYLQPDAHFALAKYYLDRKNPVKAFFILEYARRYRFEEKEFDKAYFAFFGDPMPEPPDNAKEAFATGSKLLTEQKYDEAEIYFQKANTLYDRSFFINAWIGRFYYKAKSDPNRALPFYFKAYFLYPHAYETEYVESRIRSITISNAENSFKTYLNDNKPLDKLLHDENPMISGMTLAEMAKNWNSEYFPRVVEAIDNDDSLVRWSAFVLSLKHAGTSRDRFIAEMESSTDLRKRGLAAYAIVERNGEEKYAALERMLTDPAELIRFDAASALIQKGSSQGRALLRKHARNERQLRLKALIETALNQVPK